MKDLGRFFDKKNPNSKNFNDSDRFEGLSNPTDGHLPGLEKFIDQICVGEDVANNKVYYEAVAMIGGKVTALNGSGPVNGHVSWYIVPSNKLMGDYIERTRQTDS